MIDLNRQAGEGGGLSSVAVDGTSILGDGDDVALSLGAIPNGTIIGGTAYFNTSVRPTVRIGGGALVVGDRWYNPSTGVEGSWNGTYWLGQESQPLYTEPVVNWANFGNIFISFTANLFIEKLLFGGWFIEGTSPNWNASNSFTLNLEGSSGVALISPVVIDNINSVTQQATTHWVWRQEIICNTPFFPTNSNSALSIKATGRVGTPTDTRSSPSLLLYVRTIL